MKSSNAAGRHSTAQHMHADILFINKKPFLVSLTQPLGLVQVSCLDNATTPILRQSIRKMFGTIGSRGMRITKFTSDNERGIVSLFQDVNAMHVEVIIVWSCCPGPTAMTSTCITYMS